MTRTPSRLFKVSLWLHRWCGLIATPFFLLLCLTGTVLVFHHEIDEALGYVPTVQGAAAMEPAQLDPVATAALARHPGYRIDNLSWDAEDHPGLVRVSLRAADANTQPERMRTWFQADTATAIEVPDAAETPTGFLLRLHAQWLLGLPGELFGAVVALLVLVSLLSGVVVYAPYMRRILFGVIRRGRGARLTQIDLHNYIGALVLGWGLVVSTTGVLLGTGSLSLAYWQATELKEMVQTHATGAPVTAAEPPAGPATAVAVAITEAEGWVPNLVFYPGTSFATPSHYLVLMKGPSGISEKLLRVTLVDARTGAHTETRSLPGYLKLILLSQPLHFGDYGGMPLKILWTLSTWLTFFITANGAWLWWHRRRANRGAV